jgi:hypothetical protein
MKSLKFLDSNQVTPAERTEAEKYYSRVARVDASQVRYIFLINTSSIYSDCYLTIPFGLELN